MKRSLIIVLSVLLSCFAFFTPSLADENIGFILNGSELSWNESEFGGIRLENSRTLIPLRIISNLMGYRVEWEKKSGTAIVLKDGQPYLFPIGKAEIVTPHGVVVTDVSNQVYNGRTYLPIRFFFETFDFEVEWMSKEKAAAYFGGNPDILGSRNYVVVNSNSDANDSYSETTVRSDEIDPGIEPTTGGEKTTARCEATSPSVELTTCSTVNTSDFSADVPFNNGSELSEREKEIGGVLLSLKDEYPEGMSWTNENRIYVWKDIVPGINEYTGRGCAAFAFEMSDHAFSSDEKAYRYDDVTNLKNKIRVGDIVRMNGNRHSVIVIDRNEDGIVIAEGNYNSAVHWGRTFTYEELETVANYYYTRYR